MEMKGEQVGRLCDMESGPLSAWAGCGLQHLGTGPWVVASVGRALGVLICSLGR